METIYITNSSMTALITKTTSSQVMRYNKMSLSAGIETSGVCKLYVFGKGRGEEVLSGQGQE